MHIVPTLIFEIKTSNLFQMQILSLLFQVILLFYFDANGDPIMANDVITSSNPLVVVVWNEKFEKIDWRECLSKVVWRITNWKGGAHSNDSIHMGSLNVN